MVLDNYLFEVIVGTYEEFVLGYKLVSHEDGEAELIQSFATHSHRASVRSVATKGKLLVSGGADETINIYDMVQRKETGMIMEHSGTVTCLCFTPDGSHLVATSEDGSIKFFRVGSWQVEKDFSTAHKGTAVNSISIHPSGKMALSVGRDHTLRTWNLVKGRPAYTTNLASRSKNLEWVVWSPGGKYYAVTMDSKLEVFSIDTAGVAYTLNFESKVTCLTFTQNQEDEGEILTGEASGKVSCYSLETGEELWHIIGTERIKSLQTILKYFVLGTSSGRVAVYHFTDMKTEPNLVATIDTGCRITCLTVHDHASLQLKKEKDEVKEKNEVTSSSPKKRKSDFKAQMSKVPKINDTRPDDLNVKCTVKSQKWQVVNSKQ